MESTLDELIFVVGPLIATVLATQVKPVLVLYLCLLLVLTGAIWLASLRDSAPPVEWSETDVHRFAIRETGMPLLTLYAVAMGAIFSSAEVTMVAFCGQHGHRGASGGVLAGMAFGSATAGLLYGSRAWRADLLDRFRLQALVFGLLPLVFLVAVDIPVLAVCALVVGLGIAPALITSFSMIERIVPANSLTEGLAWLMTGLSIGYGAGAALVGRIADAYGARTAFSVTIGAGLLMGLLALVIHARLRTRPRTGAPAPIG